MSEAAAIDPIERGDPVRVANNGNVRCGRKTRSGKPCDKWAVPGGSVCYMHGGNAPQVRAAATLRLLLAADTTAKRLLALTQTARGIPPSVRLAAINSVLDRCGIRPDTDLVQARVQAIRATVEANNPESGDTLITDIEIRLVGGSQAQVVDVDVEHVNGKVNGHG